MRKRGKKKYNKDEDDDNVHEWDDIEDEGKKPVIATQDEINYYNLGT